MERHLVGTSSYLLCRSDPISLNGVADRRVVLAHLQRRIQLLQLIKRLVPHSGHVHLNLDWSHVEKQQIEAKDGAS
jgi:hypothetical protein